MSQRPKPPPEGALIKAALKRNKLSVRAAARQAGISEGWWRQITLGYQNLSGGGYGPVRGPADTVACMARAAGIAPEDLEQVGRGDAAKELRRMSAADLDTITRGVAPAQVRAIMAILDTLPNRSEREEVLQEAADRVRRDETVDNSTDKREAM